MRVPRAVVFFASLAVGVLSSCMPSPGCSAEQKANLSREAFISEMLTASRTDKTSCFDDYTPGSYHVNKFDLIEGVRNLSDSATKHVDAVLIVGPEGPLWSYHVITVITTVGADESVVVNHIVFAHARIRSKSTMTQSREQYFRIMREIQSNPLLRVATQEDKAGTNEYGTMFVTANIVAQNPDLVLPDSAAYMESEALEALYDALNKLSGGDKAEVTYD